ncbi:MAG: hypothetical protein WA634_08070 [Silvibacterium sp.]
MTSKGSEDVLRGVSIQNAVEVLTKRWKTAEGLTTGEAVTNHSGYTVYDATWVCAAVWNGSCPGGAHVIADVIPSPSEVSHVINIGVAITKYRFLWHWGDGNFKFIDCDAGPGNYFPVVGANWPGRASVGASKDGQLALHEIVEHFPSVPMPKK